LLLIGVFLVAILYSFILLNLKNVP
jgi:hypothetical protein